MVLQTPQIESMAQDYADAWTSQDPAAVVAHYDENGRIAINDGEPTIGRAAIAEMVQGFYDAFPDLVVKLDRVRTAGNSAVFMWTLEGTNAETNNFVRVSGWEAWRLSDDVKILTSDGRFDAVEYERQIQDGI